MSVASETGVDPCVNPALQASLSTPLQACLQLAFRRAAHLALCSAAQSNGQLCRERKVVLALVSQVEHPETWHLQRIDALGVQLLDELFRHQACAVPATRGQLMRSASATIAST